MQTDEFGGVPADEPRPPIAAARDEFGGVAVDTRPPNFADPVDREWVKQRAEGGILGVIGAGVDHYVEGYTRAGPLGMSPENVKQMQDWGIFRKERDEGVQGVFRAFNETVLYQGAKVLDGMLRQPGAIYEGLQGAGVEAGLPRDVVSMPDAFLGSPHPMGIPEASTVPHVAPTAILQEANRLGVVGDERPPVAQGTPEQAARATVDGPAMAAGRTGDDVLRGPEPGAQDPWRDRFEQFVSKLETPDDVKQLIRDAADGNGDFPEARSGAIPLSHVEALSEAAGVPSAELTAQQRDGIGRLLQNDAQVRTAMQMMLKLTDDVKEAARNVKADDAPENLIAMQEAMMRRDIAVEQVVGLRAEWGRTGNVFQEFMRDVKDQEGLTEFLKSRGRSPDGLRDIADMLDTLDRGQAASFLHDARTPGFWDKYLFYWVNSLISGPVTHAKYVGANAAFGAYEAAVVTPIAGAIGTVRELAGDTGDRVYLGETAARTWGLLAGTPDALKAAFTAAKKNIQVPLPGQIAKAGEMAAKTGLTPEAILARTNPFTQTRPNPIGGTLGTIAGIPARGATAIHSFFNFLGYRAELEARAYRSAAKEGLSPTSDDFWQRYAWHAANPSEEAMDAGIKNGYHLTFISEQGELGKAVSRFANTRLGESGIQPFKLIFPFTHIPGNILKAAMEQTPAAFLDSGMRADLLGKNGAVARDTAYARIAGGALISGMVVNWAVNDKVTGYGPTDPEDRRRWLRTHEPYSIRLGGSWVSYNRFGPIGDLMGITANLAEVGPQVKEGEYAEAAGRIVKAASHLLMDEVGMQGLANIIQASDEPDRFASRYLSAQAATNLPFSSLLRQTASFNDPYMREAKTFVDGLRYAIPYARQDLLPKRDWLGAPMENSGYHSILRTKTANDDPVDMEAQRLVLRPAPPQDRIGGVKLSPELYDEYQATAGTLKRFALDKMVSLPNWYDLPAFARQTAMHNVIQQADKSAGAAMQLHHPELIQQGMQQRIDWINGTSPTKRPKRAPQPAPQ